MTRIGSAACLLLIVFTACVHTSATNRCFGPLKVERRLYCVLDGDTVVEAGTRLAVAVSIENTSKKDILHVPRAILPAQSPPYRGALVVRFGDRLLTLREDSAPPPIEVMRIAPGERVRGEVDLGRLFPEIAPRGSYEVILQGYVSELYEGDRLVRRQPSSATHALVSCNPLRITVN